MAREADRQIVVTSADLERLQLLLESSRQRHRWEDLHLRALAEELDAADVVEPKDVPGNVVTMRSRLRVLDMVSGQESTYTMCYPSEADIETGKLSVLAPIGTALLGYREGDVIEWPVPGGVRVLKIVALLHQPEAAGRPRRIKES